MWNIVAIVLGTILALFGVFSGSGKLIPGHPMYPMMVEIFDLAFGPFQGVPGTALRVFAGVPMLAGSLGMLIGLYVELFGLMGDSISWVQALVICAAIGMVGLMGYAGYADVSLGRMPVPVPVTVMWVLVLVARLLVTPFGEFPEGEQMLIEVFAGLTLAVVLTSAVMHCTLGQPSEAIKPIAAEVDKKYNGPAETADAEKPLQG